jgi:citrate lyase subunit beta/citryl-CoA lyase
MQRVQMTQGKTSRRSWLLVPASRSGDVASAAKSGSDVIVLDLVELVAEQDKPAARQAVRAAIVAAGAGGSEVFAQIDPQFLGADLEAAVWPGLAGVVVSRAESAEQIAEAAALIACFETEREMAADSVGIVPALETAQGNHAAYDILHASPRVCGATLGRADLVMDLRPEPSGEIHLMPYLMQRLVIVAGAAGVPPIGAWWRAPARGLLATPENTYDAGYRGRAIGFKGAMCLKADQVAALNKAYA